MTAPTKTPPTYADLKRAANAEQLLDRGFYHYHELVATTAALGAAAIALTTRESRWRYLAIPAWSLCWMQIGFMGHDAGHNAVFQDHEHNRRFGLGMFPTLLGMTFRPWVIRHNIHHGDPNVEEKDEDLGNKVICYLREEAAKTRGLRRFIVRHQAKLFPFLTLFATAGFRIDAWRYALGFEKEKYTEPDGTIKHNGERKLELALLVLNALAWLVLPAKLLGFKRWYSILIPAQMLFGLHMANAFAPNHKYMPKFTKENKPGFGELQVRASSNVSPNWLTNWLYGGLNLQIEHHLAPTLPRKNQMRFRALVQWYCRENGYPYTEVSVLESLRLIYGALDEAAQGAKGEVAID